MSSPAGARSSLATQLRAGLPALVVGLLVAFLLRSTSLSAGARVAASFFSFVVLHRFFLGRITGDSASRLAWPSTLAIGVLAALAMWFIADY